MKKKIDIRIWLIVILTLVLIGLIYWYWRAEDANPSIQNSYQETIQTLEEVEVEKKTIQNTIVSNGEISSSLSQELALHATYYFSEIFYGENEEIKAGEKILEYTNGTAMVAPYNLVITKINVPEKGEKCTNQHSITVCATDTLKMTISIAEEQKDKVKLGQQGKISLTVNEQTSYIGYVTNISNTATYSSNGSKFSVTVEFANKDAVRIGMSATCQIILEKAEEAIVVPKEAVTTQNGKSYVMLMDNGNICQVEVSIGIENDAYTQIVTGLTEGQIVRSRKRRKGIDQSRFSK